MNPKYQEIATINARLITDKPVRKTPYQVKGILMKQFANQEIVPMLDGSYREKFLYPRVQVKILNEQIVKSKSIRIDFNQQKNLLGIVLLHHGLH